jgi:hypothetical protein
MFKLYFVIFNPIKLTWFLFLVPIRKLFLLNFLIHDAKLFSLWLKKIYSSINFVSHALSNRQRNL